MHFLAYACGSQSHSILFVCLLLFKFCANLVPKAIENLSGGVNTFRGIAHTHIVYVCSSALTPSSTRSVLAGPRDRLGHPDTAYHKSASHSLMHGLADALKYTLEWAAVVCTAIPHLSVHFVQSSADIIEYNLE